jgi:hypothetical protein
LTDAIDRILIGGALADAVALSVFVLTESTNVAQATNVNAIPIRTEPAFNASFIFPAIT